MPTIAGTNSPTQKLTSGQGQTINIQTVGNTGGLIAGIKDAMKQSGKTAKIKGFLQALNPKDGTVTLTGVTGGQNLMNQGTRDDIGFYVLAAGALVDNPQFGTRFLSQFQQQEQELNTTNIVIGGEKDASPLVLGVVGSNFVLSTDGETSINSHINSQISAKAGNTFGIVGGSALIADTFGKKAPVTVTAQGGQSNIQIVDKANAALVMGGGLSFAVKDSVVTSNVESSNITVNTMPNFKNSAIDGLVVGVLGGGSALSMANAKATANVANLTKIDLTSGMVIGTVGGGMAVGFDMSVPQIQVPDKKDDPSGYWKWQAVKNAVDSALKEGSGTSTANSGDIVINVGEAAKTAALIGGGIAVADASGNNVGSGTANAKSVTMVVNGLQSQDLTGAEREEFQKKKKPTATEVKSLIAAIKSGDAAQLSPVLDRVNVDGVHVATMGGGLALSRTYFYENGKTPGAATATSHIGTVDLTLNGGYNVATALGGLAVTYDKTGFAKADQATSSSSIDNAVLNINGGENVLVSAGGMAYATAKKDGSTTDYPEANSMGTATAEIGNVTVNMTNGWVDGLFGAGIAVDATNAQATNASTHTQNVTMNVTGGQINTITIDPLIHAGQGGSTSGIPSDKTYLSKTAETIGKTTALVGGGIASGAGAQATVDHLTIALGDKATVEGNTYLGGVATLGATATVGTADLTINGTTLNGNLYLGGLAGVNGADKFDTAYQTATSTVGTANVELVSGVMTGDILAQGDAINPTDNVGVDTVTVTLHEGFTFSEDKLDHTIDGTSNTLSTLVLVGTNDFINGNRDNVKVSGFNALTVADNSTVLMQEMQLDKSLTVGQGADLKIATLSSGTLDAPFQYNINSANVFIETNDIKSYGVHASGEVNDALAGDMNELLDRLGYDTAEGLVANADTPLMEEGEVFGAVTQDENGNFVQASNTKNEAKSNLLNNTPRMIARVQMNELRKRMGDIRSGEGASGVWARYNGGKFTGDYGLDTDFHMIQAGFDTMPTADSARFGVSLSYAKVDAEDNFSSADMDSYSLAGYGVWAAENGMFADVIARMATTDTDFAYRGNKAKFDNVLLSASGELGWRFDLAEQFYVEPSAELSYTYMDGENFQLGNVSHSMSSMDSLIARAGLTAGVKCPSGFGDAYVRVAGVHEFLGDTQLSSTINGQTAVVPSDGKDSWVEYAVGANINFNKSTYMYVDIERTAGAKVKEDWRANVGVRYSF